MKSVRSKFIRKLSAKVALGIFFGTTLGVAAIALFSFRFTHAALEKSIMDNQLELAKQTLNKIDRLLYERLIDIQQMAGEDAIGNFVVGLEAKNTVPDLNLQRSLGERMNQLTLVTGPWDVLFVVDKNGKVVLSASEKLLGDSIEAYPYKAIAWKASMKGETYYSDLVISKDTGRPAIIFSAPIHDMENPDRPIVGVVVGNFSWPAVLEILDEVPVQAVLLNQSGKPIGNAQTMSRPELIADMLNKGPAFPQFIRKHSESVILPTGQGLLPEKALSSIAVQSGYLSYKGSDWRLILETPVAVAFAPATQTAKKLVLLIVPIILVTSGIFLFLIMAFVTRPVAFLNRAIHAIAAGDLSQQVQVHSQDEIGDLATSFNMMTSRLKESYETLEKKVDQRTSELSKTNEILKKEIEERRRLENIAVQSEKMAAVGQLAGGVAHEINNPLGVILGFAQGLVRRITPGDPHEMPLKSIEREAVRCKGLVQDLLTFSRVNRTDKDEVDLNEAIESSLSLVLAQSKVKHVSLVKNFSTNLPKIFANKNQLQQVIVNLCNNAMDAMPDGGTITLLTKQSSLNGKDAVEIRVEDTGQGIPKEIQAKIFEPFFTTKEVGKGTGLGLSLVYEIIQKHQGQIRVESQVGKGTAFSVCLPAR